MSRYDAPFQIHLSTCFALMLVIGLVVQLNLKVIGKLEQVFRSGETFVVLSGFLILASFCLVCAVGYYLERWIRFREGETVRSSIEITERTEETIKTLTQMKRRLPTSTPEISQTPEAREAPNAPKARIHIITLVVLIALSGTFGSRILTHFSRLADDLMYGHIRLQEMGIHLFPLLGYLAAIILGGVFFETAIRFWNRSHRTGRE